MVLIYDKDKPREVRRDVLELDIYFKDRLNFISNNVSQKDVEKYSHINENKTVYGVTYISKYEKEIVKMNKMEYVKDKKFYMLYHDKHKITKFVNIPIINKKEKITYLSDFYRDKLQQLLNSVSNLKIEDVSSMRDSEIIEMINKNKINNVRVINIRKSDIPPFISYLKKIKKSVNSDVKYINLHMEEYSEHERLIEEIVRTSKNGTQITITDYNIENAKDQALLNLAYQVYGFSKYFYFRSFKEWKEIFLKHGLIPTKVSFSDWFEFTVECRVDKLQGKFFHNQPHLRQALYTGNERYSKYNKSLRFITDTSGKMEETNKNERKTTIYSEERKELISAIEFLTEKKLNVVIVNGLKSWKHIPYLNELFPKTKLMLYGVNNNYIDNLDKPNITFSSEKITLKEIKKIKNLLVGKIGFISEIGNREIKTLEDEKTNWDEMLHQKQLVLNLKPDHSMLEFRLPNKNEINTDYFGQDIEYLRGEIRTQIWSKNNSTKTYLWIDKSDSFESASYNLNYQEKLNYFNNVTRVQYYNTDFFFTDHCYDCVSESYILRQYQLTNDLPADQSTVRKMSDKITNYFIEENIKPKVNDVVMFYDLPFKHSPKYPQIKFQFPNVNFDFISEELFYDNLHTQLISQKIYHPIPFIDFPNIDTFSYIISAGSKRLSNTISEKFGVSANFIDVDFESNSVSGIPPNIDPLSISPGLIIISMIFYKIDDKYKFMESLLSGRKEKPYILVQDYVLEEESDKYIFDFSDCYTSASKETFNFVDWKSSSRNYFSFLEFVQFFKSFGYEYLSSAVDPEDIFNRKCFLFNPYREKKKE